MVLELNIIVGHYLKSKGISKWFRTSNKKKDEYSLNLKSTYN